jgi:23S rRNA pseudouridine955/2504/2580 synthase
MAEFSRKQPARTVTVDADSAGRRLDNFLLTELRGLPRTRVYRMIRKGEVRVNKGRARPTTRLAAGDTVRIPPLQPADRQDAVVAANPGRVDWLQERVLYEDDVLLILDKPAGLAVHGGSGISLGVIELLRVARPDCRFLELAHRLDRDTSGCLIVCKKRSALRELHRQLREGEVDKRYLALLSGAWDNGARDVDLPLVTEHRQNGERFVRVGADGKAARSRFEPRRRMSAATLCEVRIMTGRTHQIRVHAAAIGHPLVGDTRYGHGSRGDGDRLWLHAHRIGFRHPRSGEAVSFEAPVPAELQAQLGRWAAADGDD